MTTKPKMESQKSQMTQNGKIGKTTGQRAVDAKPEQPDSP
jgi:hypothetical protein